MDKKSKVMQFVLSSEDLRVIELKKHLEKENINIVDDQYLALVEENQTSVFVLAEQNKQTIIYTATFNDDHTIKDGNKEEVDIGNDQEETTDLENEEEPNEPLEDRVQALSKCPRGQEWRTYNCKNVKKFNPAVFGACMAVIRKASTCTTRATRIQRECLADCFPVIIA
jgi:hypothetical protein